MLDDADLAAVIGGAASAIFFNQGQVCTAGSRLYVQKKLFDKVVDGIAGSAEKMKLGSGLDPTTQIAPLVSERHRDRVWSYIEAGKAQGARAGGRRYSARTARLLRQADRLRRRGGQHAYRPGGDFRTRPGCHAI